MPMVEPEVLMDGDHDIEVCYDVTEVTLRSLFGSLYEQNVLLEGTILKASMVIPGKNCAEQASTEEVAEATVRCLKASVPAALPGIVFLSGGQSDEQATANLNAMNQLGPTPLAAQLQLRSCDATGGLEAMGERYARQFCRSAENRCSTRPCEWTRCARSVGKERIAKSLHFQNNDDAGLAPASSFVRPVC